MFHEPSPVAGVSTVLLEPLAPSQCFGNVHYYVPNCSPQLSQNSSPTDAIVPPGGHVRVTPGDVLINNK